MKIALLCDGASLLISVNVMHLDLVLRRMPTRRRERVLEIEGCRKVQRVIFWQSVAVHHPHLLQELLPTLTASSDIIIELIIELH